MAKTTKKARDYCGLLQDDKDIINNLSEDEIEELGGVFGGIRKQTQCKRLMVPSEKIIGESIDGNAFITIGNDRPAGPHTGTGGMGHTQCDSIDLVAGMGGYCPARWEEDPEMVGLGMESFREVETNPIFHKKQKSIKILVLVMNLVLLAE